MVKILEIMNFIEFTKLYPDEDSCIKHFRELKEKQGLVCPFCGSTEFYWSQKYKSHDCKNCSYRINLRSGTIMESSHLPFKYWFYAMYLMVMLKKSVSALEVQRQLEHKYYHPIWAMMHKIRRVMGNRDEKYELDGVVELDDAFFKTHSDKKTKKPNKRGRGSEGQSKVLVMAKVVPKIGRPKKHKKSSAFRYVKMDVIPGSGAEVVNQAVSTDVATSSTIKSDGWRGFKRIKEVAAKHDQRVVIPSQASKVLPWVHVMISNAKRNLLGTYHKTKNVYLQNYLNEFCYKTNRRLFHADLFEHLLLASVQYTRFDKLEYKNA
jgi:transposase-like protein